MPQAIQFEGLTLLLVTPDVAQRRPWARGFGNGLADDLRKHVGATTRKTIIELYQPGDNLYYWDGPWGVLCGSCGLALVRRGRVVDTFTVGVS